MMWMLLLFAACSPYFIMGLVFNRLYRNET